MSPVSLTLSFPSIADAHAALSRLASDTSIAYVDRPDVGAPPPADWISLSAAIQSAPPAVNPFVVAAAPEAAVVPLPPSAPAAPSAPATVPTPPIAVAAPTGARELDSKGLPWDGRIHGATQSKNSDGSWRQKRGLNDEALKNRVEAELRAGVAAAPAAPIPVPAPPAIVAPSPAVSAAPASAPTETFGQLMARLAPVMATPGGGAKVNEALAVFGLSSLGGLAAKPEIVAPFAATIDAMLMAA